jgi:alkane 1-monooxygenase
MADQTLIPPAKLARFSRALPFWLSLGLIPLAWFSALTGGWTVLLLPIVTWYLFSLLDAVIGLDLDNADLSATDDDMFWYRMVTLVWVPAQ